MSNCHALPCACRQALAPVCTAKRTDASSSSSGHGSPNAVDDQPGTSTATTTPESASTAATSAPTSPQKAQSADHGAEQSAPDRPTVAKSSDTAGAEGNAAFMQNLQQLLRQIEPLTGAQMADAWECGVRVHQDRRLCAQYGVKLRITLWRATDGCDFTLVAPQASHWCMGGGGDGGVGWEGCMDGRDAGHLQDWNALEPLAPPSDRPRTCPRTCPTPHLPA